MQHAGCDSWRQTYVINQGQHSLIDYADLWRYEAMFNSHGFVDNYLWYSFRTVRTFRDGPDSNVKWASCRNDTGDISPLPNHEVPSNNTGAPTGLCTDRIVPQAGNVLDIFTDSQVTLPVFSFVDGSFIARACGNFSAAPTVNPVPTISGTKYHDTNRNGRRDPGEAGLQGWKIRLVRDSSALNPPQTAGHAVATTTSGPDGTYSFSLWEQGPGTYHVEEEGQTGWVQTAAPGPIHVGFGVGSHDFGGNDLGNVEDRADVVKVAWDVVAPPDSIHARETVNLRVRATLTNNGPAPEVDVEDVVTAKGPEDCVVAPPQQAAVRRLRKGEVVEIDFDVAVTCADPSFHTFVFDNQVRVLGGVADPNEANNSRSTSVTIAVIDDADVGIHNLGLDCPGRTDVDQSFRCTGSADAVNHGPYGPASTDAALTLAVPADCTVVGGPDRRFDDLAIGVGSPQRVDAAWDITCESRSFHPVSMSATATLDHLHVQDLNADNDTEAIGDLVEVFEPADLSITQPMRIACGARLPTISSFGCDVRMTIVNGGPATDVATKTTAALTAPPDCTVTPTPQEASVVLAAGASAPLAFHFDVQCTAPVLHTLLATAVIATDEPHAEDRNLANNTARVRWVPTDAKPGSEPSSVNATKDGALPVAILSTPEFDAPVEVVRSSLRYGATGTEASLLGCGATGEDTNADGFVDLVCKFATPLTGFTCATKEGILTGVLVDGTPFESQDPVNAVGCKH